MKHLSKCLALVLAAALVLGLAACGKDTTGDDWRASGVVTDYGTIARDGDADRYADLDNAEFYASDGHLRYYDGENIFFLPDTYAVAADGLAYDGAGNAYAAGWDMPYYDPADDWGDNWASSWG